MANKKIWFAGVAVILIGVILFLRLRTPEDTWICDNGNWVKHGNPSFPMPTGTCKPGDQVISGEEPVLLPNPASKNCQDKGGQLEMIQETAGTLGVCKFNDGTVCEEWQFFRGECQQGQFQKVDTTHPYLGKLNQKDSKYYFITDSGVEYSLVLPESASKEMKERISREVESGEKITILAAEDPPLSKILTLKGFQNK